MVALKTKPINLATQMLDLKRKFPDAECTVKRSRLRWRGTLMPTPLSKAYTLRLEYSLENGPDVFVENPELETRDGEKPPHLYPNGSLCLYLPSGREWDRDQLLARTIIPWSSEWLLHYELWLVTGEWHGGGIHPGGRPELN